MAATGSTTTATTPTQATPAETTATETTLTQTTPIANSLQWFGIKTWIAIRTLDRGLELKLPAFVIFCSFFVITFLAVRYENAGPLQFFEAVTLGVMGAFSTYNYRLVCDGIRDVKNRHKDSVPNPEVFLTNLFACINALFFALALRSLLFSTEGGPHRYLFWVFLIFLAFAASNIWHAYMLRSSSDPFLLEVISWLRSENGPSVVGYAILVVVTAALDSWYGVGAKRNHIEAFAAGAATFHLAISVVNFSLGAKREGTPLNCVLEGVNWDDVKKPDLAKSVTSTLWFWIVVLIVCFVCSRVGVSFRTWVAQHSGPFLIQAWQCMKRSGPFLIQVWRCMKRS